MASTYSSIATHMWPPPSSDMASSLQRLQELEQLRKQRQSTSTIISGEPTDAGTRLSRRQQIGGHTAGMRKLLDSHEERRKTFVGRRPLTEKRNLNDNNSFSMSQGNLDYSGHYGGARPKNLDILSLRTRVLTQQDGDYTGRERSSSLTNSDENGISPLLRSHSATGLQSNQSGSYGDLVEGFNKDSHSQTSESTINTSISEDEEDIEHFKRSLLGVQNLTDVLERDEPVLQPSLPTFTINKNEIDTSRLLIHRSEPQERTSSFTKLDSAVSSQPNQQRVQNMVSESMKRLDSLFDTPKMSNTKSDTLPRSQRFMTQSERLAQRSRTSSKETDVRSLHRRGRDVKYTINRSEDKIDQFPNPERESSGISQYDVELNQPIQSKDKMDDLQSEFVNNHEIDLDDERQLSESSLSDNNLCKISDGTNEKEDISTRVISGSFISVTDQTSHEISTDENVETESDLQNPEKTLHKTSEMIDFNEENKTELSQDSHVTAETDGHVTMQNNVDQTETSESTYEQDLNSGEDTYNSYTYLDQSEREEDLVNASNVGFFETESTGIQYPIFNGNTFNSVSYDVSDFTHFSNTHEFLNYDQNNRNDSEPTSMSYYDLSSDNIPSRSYRSMSVDNQSHFKTLPYSRREQPYGLNNTAISDRKGSFGVSGITKDALSRIDDLFGQKTETTSRRNEIQTTIPCRRARDSLVGSRPGISRIRSDSGEGTSYESRRTALLTRTYSNAQSDEPRVNYQGSQYTAVSSDEGELAGRSSYVIDIKGRREENANHIDNIRKRIYSDSQSSPSTIYARDNNGHGALLYNRSKSVELASNDNRLESDAFNNLKPDSSEISNGEDLVSKINKLTSEISSEFFSNGDIELQDSSKPSTAENVIGEEVSNDQFEDGSYEMTLDEDLAFTSSTYEVEMGQVLFCTSQNEKGRELDGINSITKTEKNTEDSSEPLSTKTEENAEDSSEPLSTKTEENAEDSSEPLSTKTEENTEDSKELLSTKTQENTEDSKELLSTKTQENNEDSKELLSTKTQENTEDSKELLSTKTQENTEDSKEFLSTKTQENTEDSKELLSTKQQQNDDKNSMEQENNDNVSESNIKELENQSQNNSDETDNISVNSHSSTISSSKKKKNKKKGKKGNNTESPKAIVSHPSELLAREKKARMESKTKQENSDNSAPKNKTTMEDKFSKKGKDMSISIKNGNIKSKTENVSNKSLKNADKAKAKKEEPKSPKREQKTPVKEKKTPTKEQKTPEKEKKTQKKEVKTPEKEQKTPKQEQNKEVDNNTDSPKSKSKLKNLFDSIIHALDHKSETSSITTSSIDDNRSLSSGEKTPVADEWEIISEPTAELNIIHEDNYATFTDEEIVADPKVGKLSDDNSGMSTDNYETASDHTISGGSDYEEFFEALPTELLGNTWNEIENPRETERKEQFVYICAGSKVRRPIKKVQTFNENNVENVNQWIENNFYPGDKYPEQAEKVPKKKFNENEQFHRNTVSQSETTVKKEESNTPSDSVVQHTNIDRNHQQEIHSDNNVDTINKPSEHNVTNSDSNNDSINKPSEHNVTNSDSNNDSINKPSELNVTNSDSNNDSINKPSELNVTNSDSNNDSINKPSELNVTNSDSNNDSINKPSELNVTNNDKSHGVQSNSGINDKNEVTKSSCNTMAATQTFVNAQKQKLLSQDKQSSEKEVKISTGGHVESESTENIRLDLKVSDQGFIDTLVNTLKGKLCLCCQGVLLDVLKETYFTRFTEMSKIDLTKPTVSTNTSLKGDKKTGNTKVDSKLEEIKLEDNKRSHKVKKLEIEDLLYGKSKECEGNSVGSVKKFVQEKNLPDKCSKTDKLGQTENKEVIMNKPKSKETTPPKTPPKSPPRTPSKMRLKEISIAPVQIYDSSPPPPVKNSSRNYSGEIKIKGKTIKMDKSKKNGKVSSKSEPKAKVGDSAAIESISNETEGDQPHKEGNDSNVDNDKVIDDEEFKLPTLKNNPFIKSDKLRTSSWKDDQEKKTDKSTMFKRSMSLNIDLSTGNPGIQPKSEIHSSIVKGTNESGNSTDSPKTDEKSKDETVINEIETSRPDSLLNGSMKKNIETDKNHKVDSVKKILPNGSKKPSMFDHLNFAKTACETLGPTESKNANKDHKTEIIVKSHESCVQDSTPKKTKTTQRKKKFTPFGDTDIIDDLDISPEELHGVPLDGDDEVAPHRINLINWDPTKLLNVLYTVKLNKDTTEDVSHKFVNMEGLMEKLPMNKKKATLLKTWKRRFFRAKDGWLHYYEGLSEDGETSNRDKPSDSVQLMGGKIEDLGNRILGVDDGRGRFLMVRCPTEKEYGQWKLALESQTADNVTYVRPALSSPPHPEKKVIIIDIGSGGIRAGIMGAQPCLPQMYFPSIVARNKTTQELVIGIDAYKPEVRKNSTLLKLVEPSNKVDKDHVRPFAIDMEMMSAVFDYIFKGLKTDPGKHWIMLSTPYKLGDGAMNNLMKILTDQFHTKGVCMVMQSLLALYSYNATSGIIVDVGERMEILPIFDGVLIEGGVSRQSYGGQKVADSLNSSLVELKYNFFSPVDKLLVRYIMEQTCYVCDNYKDLKIKCDKDSIDYQTTVYLNNFDLPDDAHLSVTHDLSCFKSTEGFFNTDMWGMDYPCVHKLVYQAIQSCPMDNRKHMYRAIYLSGGVTMLPGFAERLQAELKKLAPPSVLVEVHASPQRYHSAFIGAGTLLSSVPINEQVFISSEEWKKDGAKAFKKWKGP